MLHPTIKIPKVGDVISATNFDVVEKVVKADVKVLTKFELMANAMPDWYIAFGHNLKNNHIESLVYYYNPDEYNEEEGPIGFGGASEENFTKKQWKQIASEYPKLFTFGVSNNDGNF